MRTMHSDRIGFIMASRKKNKNKKNDIGYADEPKRKMMQCSQDTATSVEAGLDSNNDREQLYIAEISAGSVMRKEECRQTA